MNGTNVWNQMENCMLITLAPNSDLCQGKENGKWKQGRVDLHCIAMKWSQSNEVVWLSNRIALGKRSNDTNFYSNHISNFPAKHLQWLNLHHRSFSRASPENRVDIYVPITACNGPLTVALHRFSVCNFTCVEEDPGKFFWNLFAAKGSRITFDCALFNQWLRPLQIYLI